MRGHRLGRVGGALAREQLLLLVAALRLPKLIDCPAGRRLLLLLLLLRPKQGEAQRLKESMLKGMAKIQETNGFCFVQLPKSESRIAPSLARTMQ